MPTTRGGKLSHIAHISLLTIYFGPVAGQSVKTKGFYSGVNEYDRGVLLPFTGLSTREIQGTHSAGC